MIRNQAMGDGLKALVHDYDNVHNNTLKCHVYATDE